MTFNGQREDLMNTVDLPYGSSFDMERCEMFFGGVPPLFDRQRFKGLELGSFLGSLR